MNESEIQRLEVLSFIEGNYVKKGEELQNDLFTGNSFDIEVMKYSTRIYKKIGNIKGSCPQESLILSGEDSRMLLTIFHSTLVKKTEKQLYSLEMDITQERLSDWVEKGLIYRKTEYLKDGKTMKRIFYVMGYLLYSMQRKNYRAEQEEMLKRLAGWISQTETLLNQLPDVRSADKYQDVALNKLYTYIEKLRAALTVSYREQAFQPVSAALEVQWRESRVSKYIHFVLAVATVRIEHEQFDWKQIGAAYYGQIGGSKAFDMEKKDFLGKLEEDLGMPLHFIGLVSLGAVTPILFAGELAGSSGLYYPAGFMHATTDLTVFEMEFSTPCRVIWLVENRALLTRLCADSLFLRSSGSLVIGLDGQIRSGHRKLIQDVMRNSPSVTQVLVWCDTDQSGGVIAAHVRELLQPFQRLKVKWLLSEPMNRQVGVYSAWEQYKQAIQQVLLEGRLMEQEEFLGGVELWKTWING
ncbi:Toprim sub domain-containing protein [Paenibacillus polymyxa]|uniref:Toprim sub domain-containing protein n=1 Tax=Paenibacillus polymyxa TaxID=1406 RepID=UPI002AB367C7|nr:Toprim sub domain-containing protein [Paenibacillus polymyxa]MDY8024845.1 Toprim sub domain-containing protein [Paenibacillus polymyxa]